MSSLKQKTLNGLFWSYLDSFGIYFIKFGFTIAIARALSPSDYGIMGMITIFIALGNILTESGFAMALIHKKDADAKDYSTVFWFNLLLGIVIYVILFLSSKQIADFFNKPILAGITKVTAIGILLSSLVVVQVTILSKELNFKKQTIINFIAAPVSGITGVILAYNGYGVWALVYMTLAGNVIRTIGFWIFSTWKPKLIFSLHSFKSLYSYGYKIFLQGLGGIIFDKVYYPLIGKYFPAAQLGFYTQANRFYELFIKRTSIAFGRVTFPSFSSIQNDKVRFNFNYLKSYRLLAIVMFPLTMFLILSSETFVAFFLTEKWLPAVPFMQAFFIEGFFLPFYILNQNILCAIGESGLSLKIDLIKKILTFTSLFIFFKYGILYLIIGQVISTFLTYILSNLLIMHQLQIKIFEITSYLLKLYIFIGIGIIPYLLSIYYFENKLIILLSIIIGLILYYLCLKFFSKNEINEVQIILNKFSNKKIINENQIN